MSANKCDGVRPVCNQMSRVIFYKTFAVIWRGTSSYRIAEFQDIFPTCKTGEIFDCQENKSNQTLDENCEKVLMFTGENSTCSCQGSNSRKFNSKNIVRKGWSKYIGKIYVFIYRSL